MLGNLLTQAKSKVPVFDNRVFVVSEARKLVGLQIVDKLFDMS